MKRQSLWLLPIIFILSLFLFGPTRLLSRAYSNLGWVSLMQDSVDQKTSDSSAINWFDTALRANPQNRSAQRGLGFARLQQGDDVGAVDAWQLVDNMGQELYHIGRQAERARLQRQLENQKQDKAVGEKVTDRSVEWYNLSTQVDPNLRDAWYQIGRQFEQQQDWPAAEEAYLAGLDATNGLQIQRSDLLFWQARLIELYHTPRDLAGALATYDKAVTQDNFGDPWVRAQTHYRRGEILREQGRVDEASRAYERVVALRPKSYWALTNLAMLAQTEKGNIAAAKSYLSTAIEVNPKLHVAYRLLAQIYEQEGDLLRAKDLYQEALNRNEDDSIAREQIRLLTDELKK